MTEASAYANAIPHGDKWLTVLYKPLYAGASVFLPTVGPVTPASRVFEGPAEWLREQGYEVESWTAVSNGCFRAELRRT
jgi:hypothetical protein